MVEREAAEAEQHKQWAACSESARLTYLRPDTAPAASAAVPLVG